MDDDLLADDGQFKDDGLEDLDIDEEAALLGLSDEEIEGERTANEEQELEYVDEDGNPVDIGENNAELYEVANIETSDKLSNLADDDVLELDLDAELDSLTQENSDALLRESPAKTYNERQCKENLIPLTSRVDREKPAPRRKETRHSPDREHDRQKNDVSFSNQGQSSRRDLRDSYVDDVEYDEESEDESVGDDHRERFKSERSNIITLTPGKRRADIPDTLESVISVEETAKVQAFLENEQKRKMRFKSKGPVRGKNSVRFARPPQNFSNMQPQQNQFPTSNSAPVCQTVPVNVSTQPRKILINPHFRGVRLPPPVSSEQVHMMHETPQVSAPISAYDTSQNFQPPVYSHHETVHPVPIAPPIFTAPPPNTQYKHPEYPPPQQHIQQPPPPMWQPPPPDLTTGSYTNPIPILNYADHLSQVSSYHNSYSPNSFQNTTYQNAPMPLPQTVNYNQPPPSVQLHSSSFSPAAPVCTVQSNITHSHYSTSQMRPLHSAMQQQQSFQDQPKMQQLNSNVQRNKFCPNQRFSRLPEKRASNLNIKPVPLKQQRLDHSQRKANFHVNNSNIREIPLIDTLPAAKKPVEKEKPPVVEEEDEKTKELRMKIEEQKLLREQILKRKEERRRQMAAQRLSELKKRQAEQNTNAVPSSQKLNEQKNQFKVPCIQNVTKPKVSVKERIGMPLTKSVAPPKKKIIVVRKKVLKDGTNVGINSINVLPNKPKIVSTTGPRLNIQAPRQSQQQAVNKSMINTSNVKPNVVLKQKPALISSANQSSKPPLLQNKPQGIAISNKADFKSALESGAKKNATSSPVHKGKTMRFGARPPFQRSPFHSPQHSQQRMPSPRFVGPRVPQFPNSPFMEHRMRFPNHCPPMNEMRMPLSPFQDPRPPLLPFLPPGEPGPFNQFFPHEGPFDSNNPHFRMRGPAFQNFRPRGVDMYHDRFPPPQFPNQIPQMRQMYEPNGPMFQRHRFHNAPMKHKPLGNRSINQQPKQNDSSVVRNTNLSAKTSGKEDNSSTISSNQATSKQTAITAKKEDEGKEPGKVCSIQSQAKSTSEIDGNPKTQSVSVENLSSSTSEIQLKKLGSSVGVVESIQLLKAERKAVIKFREPSQALNFQKKYQRYMLDLAMIQVSLLST